MARLAAFRKYGKWQKGTGRREHRHNRSVARNRAPTEKPASHALIVAASSAVRSRAWQGQIGKAERQEIRAGSGGKCTCTQYGVTPKHQNAISRGKRRRCRSVPKVKPPERSCTPLSYTNGKRKYRCRLPRESDCIKVNKK